MTGDDSSEERVTCGSDRSSIFDELMAKNCLKNAEQEDHQVEEESPLWMGGPCRLQDHLVAKASLPANGPDAGAGEKKAMDSSSWAECILTFFFSAIWDL